MMEPTEMGQAPKADTESINAWALDDDPDEFPTQRLTPRRITSMSLTASLVLIAVAGAVALIVIRQHGHVAETEARPAPPTVTMTLPPPVTVTVQATPAPTTTTTPNRDSRFAYGVTVDGDCSDPPRFGKTDGGKVLRCMYDHHWADVGKFVGFRQHGAPCGFADDDGMVMSPDGREMVCLTWPEGTPAHWEYGP